MLGSKVMQTGSGGWSIYEPLDVNKRCGLQVLNNILEVSLIRFKL